MRGTVAVLMCTGLLLAAGACGEDSEVRSRQTRPEDPASATPEKRTTSSDADTAPKATATPASAPTKAPTTQQNAPAKTKVDAPTATVKPKTAGDDDPYYATPTPGAPDIPQPPGGPGY